MIIRHDGLHVWGSLNRGVVEEEEVVVKTTALANKTRRIVVGTAQLMGNAGDCSRKAFTCFN